MIAKYGWQAKRCHVHPPAYLWSSRRRCQRACSAIVQSLGALCKTRCPRLWSTLRFPSLAWGRKAQKRFSGSSHPERTINPVSICKSLSTPHESVKSHQGGLLKNRPRFRTFFALWPSLTAGSALTIAHTLFSAGLGVGRQSKRILRFICSLSRQCSNRYCRMLWCRAWTQFAPVGPGRGAFQKQGKKQPG